VLLHFAGADFDGRTGRATKTKNPTQMQLRASCGNSVCIYHITYTYIARAYAFAHVHNKNTNN